MTPLGKFAVVLVAFNEADLIQATLASLRAGTLLPGAIYVVDNSTDDAVEAALSGDPGLTYFRTAENLGFCEASNIGIRAALEKGAEWVLLLNPDVVLEPDCLERLVARAVKEGGRSLVAPKIRMLPRRELLWYAGGDFKPWVGAGVNRGFGSPDDGRFDAPGPVTYATGCCLLVPAQAFRSVGLLNQDIFMYLDDIEFCLRARKAGFGVFYEPAAVLYHRLGSGAVLSRRPAYYLYFSIRNKPRVVSGGGPYGVYLHLLAPLFGLAKIGQFALLPGIRDRRVKIRALAWGIVDAFSSRQRVRQRFPALFARSGTNPGTGHL